MTITITVDVKDFDILKTKGYYLRDSVGQEIIIYEGIIIHPDRIKEEKEKTYGDNL
jgi:hypothetical protein